MGFEEIAAVVGALAAVLIANLTATFVKYPNVACCFVVAFVFGPRDTELCAVARPSCRLRATMRGLKLHPYVRRSG